MKKLNIGVDLDGVVYDFWGTFSPWIEKQSFSTGKVGTPDKWDFWSNWGIDHAQFNALMGMAIRDGVLFREGDPIPGALEGLQELTARGHHIVIATERKLPGFELDARRATYEWLSKHAVPHDALIIGPKRGLMLDVILDDAPHVINQVAEEDRLAVFYDQPWNRVDTTTPRVKNWPEFVALCAELAADVSPVAQAA